MSSRHPQPDEHYLRLTDGSSSVGYYHQDRMGSVIAISEAQTPTSVPNIKEWAYYTAYGKQSLFDSSGSPLEASIVDNHFGFQGHRQDEAIGLVDMRARMYQPAMGRFLNRDPIGLAGGNNQLAFVGSSPLMYTDPTGLYKNYPDAGRLLNSRLSASIAQQKSIARLRATNPTYWDGVRGRAAEMQSVTGEALYEMGEGFVLSVQSNLESFKQGGLAQVYADGVIDMYRGLRAIPDVVVNGSNRDRAKLGIQIGVGVFGARALSLARSSRGVGAARGGVNLASPQRTRHILYGDATGGGHKFGLSRLFNGKSKFPATWSDSRIMNAVSEVATSPSSTWVQQTGRAGASLTRRGVPVKFKVEGVYDGVKIRAIVQGDDIITAFPIR